MVDSSPVVLVAKASVDPAVQVLACLVRSLAACPVARLGGWETDCGEHSLVYSQDSAWDILRRRKYGRGSCARMLGHVQHIDCWGPVPMSGNFFSRKLDKYSPERFACPEPGQVVGCFRFTIALAILRVGSLQRKRLLEGQCAIRKRYLDTGLVQRCLDGNNHLAR